MYRFNLEVRKAAIFTNEMYFKDTSQLVTPSEAACRVFLPLRLDLGSQEVTKKHRPEKS